MKIKKRCLDKIKSIVYKIKLRIYIIKLENRKIHIKRPYIFNIAKNVEFGENIYIGQGSFFMAKAPIKIGNNVRIGPNCSIWTENHNYRSNEMIPYDYKDIARPVTICDNVWIGMNVSICPGTVIGEGAIIGMGAVVRGVISSGAIVMGNPGKIIGTRNMDVYYRLKLSKAFHEL